MMMMSSRNVSAGDAIPNFVCVLMIGSVFLTVVNTQATLGSASSHDELLKTLLDGYNKLDKPPNFVTVNFGLAVIGYDVDEKQRTLNLHTWHRLASTARWEDRRFVWDPKDFGGLQVLRVPSSLVWLPDVTLINEHKERSGNGRSMVSNKQEQNVLIYNNGEVLYMPVMYFSALCGKGDMRTTEWPFGHQTCSLAFASWTYPGTQLGLALPTNNYTSDFQDVHLRGNWVIQDIGWHLRDTLDMTSLPLPGHAMVEVTFAIQGNCDKFLATLQGPLIAALMLMLASLWMPPALTLAVAVFNTAVILGLFTYYSSYLPVDYEEPLLYSAMVTYMKSLLMTQAVVGIWTLLLVPASRAVAQGLARSVRARMKAVFLSTFAAFDPFQQQHQHQDATTIMASSWSPHHHHHHHHYPRDDCIRDEEDATAALILASGQAVMFCVATVAALVAHCRFLYYPYYRHYYDTESTV
ncbi:unnamed protein product [Notodromas monacha]|uniref:Neurotransmitter-gated ion-channel ligand-binding domain-containing protein n=1 Tax=Notodromas monacha TaxID=399045 RepID=A0A7R9BIW1_9CRUS|nr:unnamed protein product [Notodromas monacha]CAG0916342.1 unnamed protein product [Notodromas monacha]